MSNKTPYEIRLDLLRIAKEMLEHEYFSAKEIIVTHWSNEVAKAMDQKYLLPEKPSLPPYPTTAEILEKAKTLNAFISNG